MKKRTSIRKGLFAAALISVLTLWGITASAKAKKYENETALIRQRALTQLCEYFDSIETGLMKSLYVGSDGMLSRITDDLLSQTAGAKESLSTLSPGETQLTNTYKFLSQVSGYTDHLSRKAAAGETVTAEERETLRDLFNCASALSSRLDFMAQLMNGDSFSFEEAEKGLPLSQSGSEKTVTYMTGIAEAEDSVTDIPTLIYDGPFSDSVLNRTSEMLESAAAVALKSAKEKAAILLGAEAETVAECGETAGRIPSYLFRKDGVTVGITKAGGYAAFMISDGAAGTKKLSEDEAREIAERFLGRAGYPGMRPTYRFVYDGICTFNFAYELGDYLCYPDLIKVSVSLDSGLVTSFDASDYIMNHKRRTVPPASVSAEEAAKGTAETLTVKDMSLAVIPSPYGTECFTYELLCEDGYGQDVLVYKDVVTGKEDDILILLYSDGGTLTK